VPPLRSLAAFLFRSGHGHLQSSRRLLSLTCRPYKFLVNLGQNVIPHKELLVVDRQANPRCPKEAPIRWPLPIATVPRARGGAPAGNPDTEAAGAIKWPA